MPGWASRSACSSTISLARSRTAACDLVLLALPAGAAELRQLRLGPARRRRISAPGRSSTPARRARTPSRNSRIRCSSALAVLVEHLHAAVAGDAVADVDDQVALGQVEEAVDGPRFEPPPRQDLPRLPRGGTARDRRATTDAALRPGGSRRGRGRSPAAAGPTAPAARPPAPRPAACTRPRCGRRSARGRRPPPRPARRAPAPTSPLKRSTDSTRR